MTYDRFLDEIQRRAIVDDREAARRILAATLETLGHRLAHHEAELIADALPEPFDELLRDSSFEGRFGVDELYERIAHRAQIPVDRAREQVQVICEQIGEIAGAEAHKHIEDLPEEIAVLFRPREIPRRPDSPRDLEPGGRTISSGRSDDTLGAGKPLGNE